MFRSSALLRSQQQHQSKLGPLSGPKLLLPYPSAWDIVVTGFRGVWASLADQKSRDFFERSIKDGVIKDGVLMNASNGSVITFNLFQNLRNPLWKRCRFDAKEFVEAVGPALENFHETLGLMRNQLGQKLKERGGDEGRGGGDSQQEELSSLEEKLSKSDEELLSSLHDNLTEALLGSNLWREEARENPESMAASLSKMTTPVCFDSFYYTSKIDLLNRTLQNSEYQSGSCKVNEVALLDARVMEMERVAASATNGGGKDGGKTAEGGGEIEDEYRPLRQGENYGTDEGEAANNNKGGDKKDAPVAAQIDVLFEVTHTYKQTEQVVDDAAAAAATVAAADDANAGTAPDSNKDDSKKEEEEAAAAAATTTTVNATAVTASQSPGDKQKEESVEEAASTSTQNDGDAKDSTSSSTSTSSPKTEIVSYTNLAVAVFEGWLHGGPENELRWRLAMLREAFEFPNAPPTITKREVAED